MTNISKSDLNATDFFISFYADVDIAPVVPNFVTRDKMYYIGVAVALVSTVFDGFLNIAINVCKEMPSLVLLWWAGVGGLVVGAVGYAFDENAKIFTLAVVEISYVEWLAYAGVAFGGIAAYFCMTKSLQMVDPTVVAFVRATEIVIAYIVQVTFMHQVPAGLSIIGAALVLTSVFAIAGQDKIVSALPVRIRNIM